MKQEWQPIETAPRDGSRLLVYCPEDNYCIAAIAISYWAHSPPNVSFIPTGDPHLWRREVQEHARFEVEGGWESPTHWMPLPEPPK